MKKLLAALLACMTITCAFASCGDKDSDSDSSSKKSSSSSSDTDGAEADDEEEEKEEETGENLSEQPASEDDEESEPSSEDKKSSKNDKKKGSSIGSADKETYVGKWQGKELTFNGKKMDSLFGLPVYALVQFELYEDGTLTSDAAEEHQEGTWNVTGSNTIEMTIDGESSEMKYEDGLLFLSESEDGVSVEFYLEKVDEFTPFDIDSWEENFDLSGFEDLLEDTDLGDGSGDLDISEDDINKALEGLEDTDWESALGDIDLDKALEGIDEEELEKALKAGASSTGIFLSQNSPRISARLSDGCSARSIPKAMSREARSVSRSISLGVTIMFGISGSTLLPVRLRTMVWTSTTVGTPIAVTGIPSMRCESSRRELATPLPGDMPLSVSWIVVPSLRTSEHARASTAMMPAGCSCAMRAVIISAVSIPV